MSQHPDIYKLYQVMSYLTISHGYKGIILRGNTKSDEVWMLNKNAKTYNIVRLTMATMDSVDYDKDRIYLCVDSISRQVNIFDPKFLDIHIGKYDVKDDEEFSTVCLDIDYYAGVNVEGSFPGIRKAIHEVSDPTQEIKSIFEEINRNAVMERKNRKLLKSLKGSKNIATIVLIVMCVLNFIAYMILSSKFDDSATYIFLGADYKPFTLCLRQFWRLLTVIFSHGSVTHLVANMYSLFFLGTYIETKYGTLNFLLLLFLSAACGSLTAGIMSPSVLNVGISGGLYGLMMVFVMESLEGGLYELRRLYPLLLVNLMINFYPSVAWQAHLGGAIIGLLFYNYFKADKTEKIAALIMSILLIAALSYKYYSVTSFTNFYPGTDMKVVSMLKSMNLERAADSLYKALMTAYQTFGQ